MYRKDTLMSRINPLEPRAEAMVLNVEGWMKLKSSGGGSAYPLAILLGKKSIAFVHLQDSSVEFMSTIVWHVFGLL